MMVVRVEQPALTEHLRTLAQDGAERDTGGGHDVDSESASLELGPRGIDIAHRRLDEQQHTIACHQGWHVAADAVQQCSTIAAGVPASR